jgi:hypothetical protein
MVAVLAAEAAAGEFVGEDVFHPRSDVGEQGGEGALGLGRGSVPHEDPEALGAFLDVGQQGQGGAFDHDAGLGFLREGHIDCVQENVELRVHHLGVQPFLGAKVFVDDGLGHSSAGGDFLNGGPVQPANGEKAAPDVDQLASALQAGHPHPRKVVAHLPIMPHRRRRDSGRRRERNVPCRAAA